MIAGRLRHLVEVQGHTIVNNDDGSTSETWASLGSGRADGKVWASIEPLTGREFFESQQTKGIATHRIRMRHYVGLGRKHRIVFESREFNIESVQEIQERGIETVAMCKEAV